MRGTSRNSSQRSSLGGSSRRQSGSLLAPPKGTIWKNFVLPLSTFSFYVFSKSKFSCFPTGLGEGSRRASNSSIRSTGSNRSHRSYSLKNPGSNHCHHQSLHHRPSDPESRSQSSQMNLSLNPQANSGGGGAGSSNNPSPVSQTNQPSPRKVSGFSSFSRFFVKKNNLP